MIVQSKENSQGVTAWIEELGIYGHGLTCPEAIAAMRMAYRAKFGSELPE